MECDTDSLYAAFADPNIDNLVKPHLRDEWLAIKPLWFPSEDTTTMVSIPTLDEPITMKQFDRRAPGKFKIEFQWVGMACLNSKVYHTWGEDLPERAGLAYTGPGKTKTSCKGVQQRRNDLQYEHFIRGLCSGHSEKFTNAGFVRVDDDMDGTSLKTYTQEKVGLSYFYGKRKVCDNGLSTTHLDI